MKHFKPWSRLLDGHHDLPRRQVGGRADTTLMAEQAAITRE
ncbi:hypothetical protein [Veronia pacifica]